MAPSVMRYIFPPVVSESKRDRRSGGIRPIDGHAGHKARGTQHRDSWTVRSNENASALTC